MAVTGVSIPEGLIRFGDCELNASAFELRRGRRTVKLERIPLQVLLMLIDQHGKVISREAIADQIWGKGVFVDVDNGINTAIRKIRRVLNDDPQNPRFVQTIAGTGYRFIAPVSGVVPARPAEGMADPAPAAAASPSGRRDLGWYLGVGACVVLAVAGTLLYRFQHRPPEVMYTQLTDFTDSAVAPVLSPDGHMVAFIRGGKAFLTSDPIYVKMLPNGEAKRVTDDYRLKYGLAFSPDGSEIAYAVWEDSGFSTYEVSSLGGEPHLLLKNAAGLVWLDPERLLFSEIQSGIHMGVVAATVTCADLREIYFPAHERAMAHYSSPSPDRRWALVVEMNGNGDWAQCRLVGLEGRGSSTLVGPTGACTSAGWSPNGSWMYFTVTVEGRSHIWRQHFPEGELEQITFGPTEEDGLAVEPDGRALITSVGVHESAIWIHDGNGDRPLSSEGEVVGQHSTPAFSPDVSVLYYLLRRGEQSSTELWRTMVDSGKSEAVFPGVSMTAFDISADGKQVVYTTPASDEKTQLWVAPLDRSMPASKVNIPGARSPHFGEHGVILFQQTEGSSDYLEQINPDGSHRSKVSRYPIAEFQGVSPSRHWAVVNLARAPESNRPAIMAIPLDGGFPRRICASYCIPRWSTDGKFLFVQVEEPSRTGPGRSLAILVSPGENLSNLPPGGIAPLAEPSLVQGAESVARAYLVPGKDPKQYAWVDTTIHRNLYRISLP